MPANLTPEYERAELRYREAVTEQERLDALQEMLSAIPKHKGTEKMQADLKRRISQLRREGQRSSQSKGPDPFHVPRSGAGQVALVGPPNTGKSSILASTTHAEPKVADYPFTTVVPQPGMWSHQDVQLELVDTPPVTADHVPAGLMGTIRNADVVALVVEAGEAALEQVEMTLGVLHARGVSLHTVPRGKLPNSDPTLRPGIIVANKADLATPGITRALAELYQPHLEVVSFSALSLAGAEILFARLWELLNMIRVYTKEPGRPPELRKPFTLPAGATVAALAQLIHRDLPQTMKYARLWGHGRFDGQQVHRTEPLQDRDVVEIHE